MSWRTVTVASVALVAGVGCSAGTEGLVRKEGPEFELETRSWLSAIDRFGGDGMWLVMRTYHPGDDVIALATNSDLSHAAVVDLSRGEVIEAVGQGVVITSLAKLVGETHRVRLIRPAGWTAERGAEAVAKARSQVGHGYDFSGIVGMPDADRFYCSELAAWSMGIRTDVKGVERVLHPKHLHEMGGTILFDSGPRDGMPDGVPEPVEGAAESSAAPPEPPAAP